MYIALLKLSLKRSCANCLFRVYFVRPRYKCEALIDCLLLSYKSSVYGIFVPDCIARRKNSPRIANIQLFSALNF